MVKSSSLVHPSGALACTDGSAKVSARPLVWLRSWRMVMSSPFGTPLITLRDVVVQMDLALADELQDEVADERLGLAGDLELHVRLEGRLRGEVGHTGRRHVGPLRAPDPYQRP